MSLTSFGTTPDRQVAVELEPPVAEDRALAAHAELHVVPPAERSSRQSSSLTPVFVGLVTALTVAVVAPEGYITWAVCCAWAVIAGVQATVHRVSVGASTRVRADLKTGVLLMCLVSVAAVSEVASVSLAEARWGIVTVAVAVLASAMTRSLQPSRAAQRRVVLVGTQHDIEMYTASVSGSDEVLVVGCHVVDAGPELPGHLGAGVPTATRDGLGELVLSMGADTVLVLPGRETDADVVRELTWSLEDTAVTVGVLTPVSSVSSHRLRTTELGHRTVLELGAVGASAIEVRAKGIVDRLGAAVILLIASPVLLFLVAAVRLDSKGPGLFVQTRVGRDGKAFRMFKLRTMHVDAEAMKQALLDDNDVDGVLFKIRRDPRVTRVGYWLRRASLDELPQLFNVLKGEMSLVGPRPALPSEVASYDAVARRRLVVKPGITGLWQVSGRSDLLWDESLRLDLYYADNWRLVDDFTIAARTVSAVTMARGAY
jgi:exopolysaccharide biosynthesis polyprenyl glycosylphosphotransferase